MDLLDIVLHYDCNLKCSYCTITDAMRARRALSLRDLALEIDRATQLGCTAMSITGGEPTIRPDLLSIVRFARSRGMTDIKVQSNGLLFASAPNLDRAIDAGVTRISVSVHAFDGRPGAYAVVTQGGEEAERLLNAAIDNLVRAPIVFAVDLIVMSSTLPTLVDAITILHSRGVRSFSLWFVSLTDANAANTGSMPRLTDAVPMLMRCMDFGREHGLTVESLHVPRCLLPGYTDHVMHPAVGRDIRVVTPDSVFDLSASRLSGGFKPERCGSCRYHDACPGLRFDYVERFGDSEVQPVA